MANRNFSRVQALNHEVKIIAGSFSIAASGGAATKVTGLGYSVAKSGTGLYTVTLQDAYNAALAVTATAQAATAVDLVAQVKSVDVTSAKTVVISLNAGATPTEPAAVTVVNFVLVLQNSSTPSV
jgi:hypothetical protein